MKRLFLLFVLTLAVSGCASTPKQSFNAAANTHIKQVAVITPPAIDEVQVMMLAHPGTSFGLVGGLIAAADMQAKTSSYNKALGSTKPDWSAYAQQQMTAELQKVGYKVETLNVRQKSDKEYLAKYPASNADAFLDYYLKLAHLAAGPTTNYVPTSSMNVRLVDAKTQKVLYEEELAAGLANNKAAVNFPASKEYKDSPTLNAHARESTEALNQGINQITQRVASDLKK